MTKRKGIALLIGILFAFACILLNGTTVKALMGVLGPYNATAKFDGSDTSHILQAQSGSGEPNGYAYGYDSSGFRYPPTAVQTWWGGWGAQVRKNGRYMCKAETGAINYGSITANRCG